MTFALRLYNSYNHAHVPYQHMWPSLGPWPNSKCSKTVEVGCARQELKSCKREITTDEIQKNCPIFMRLRPGSGGSRRRAAHEFGGGAVRARFRAPRAAAPGPSQGTGIRAPQRTRTRGQSPYGARRGLRLPEQRLGLGHGSRYAKGAAAAPAGGACGAARPSSAREGGAGMSPARAHAHTRT